MVTHPSRWTTTQAGFSYMHPNNEIRALAARLDIVSLRLESTGLILIALVAPAAATFLLAAFLNHI